MLVALPSALAFGVAVHSTLGPSYAAQGALAGLIGAAAIGMVAPALGGAPRLVSAPCAPAAAVLAAFAAELLAPGPGVAMAPETVVVLLTVVALLSGGLQVVYGAAGGGRLIKFIPYPVVTGYLSGVAVLIFLAQAPRLLVLPKGMTLLQGLASPGAWSLPGLLIGLAAIFGMVGAPRLTKSVPAPIVGLLSGVAAYWASAFAWPELRALAGNPLVVGPLAAGGGEGMLARWSALARLDASALGRAVVPAATLSVLLSIDTLKTCVVVDALTRSRHDSDAELRGQGLGNLASALLGGMPGAGTMGATLVNVNSGGRTRWSGVLAGVFCLLAFLTARRALAWVPTPALAGILLVVAWRMYDRKSLRLLRGRSTLFDFMVSATVIVTAVAVDLMAAAGAGLALAILLFMRDLIKGSVIHRKLPGDKIFSRQRRLPAEREALKALGSQTVVCELQGNLFFGTTDQLYSELDEDLKSRRFVILDLRRVQSVDFTAAHLLKLIEDRLHDKNGRLILCRLPQNLPSGQDLESYFGEVGLVKPKRYVSLFADLDAALEWVEDRLLEEAGQLQPHSPVPLELGEIDLLRELDPEGLAGLRSFLVEESFEPDRRIFSAGDAGDDVYLIRKGQVRIKLPLDGDRGHHIATFGRSDFFGEVAFLDRGARTADAVAIAPTMVYRLSRARFDELSRARPALGAMLFARLARALALRLRETDQELRALQEA
ncbi:MAG: SLC26A/SulP transporter family protein [Elusimicrobia bacterium]|nr:SLC26A/SulP transporter family protein [Elusimicrobiota bacterium]